MKSESIKELATALAKAQGQMKGALKDANNPFFKTKYADLASVVEAIREAFSANGLSYIQSVEPSEKDEVRIETTILHSSGEWFSAGVLALPVAKHDAQGFGSALTYARRYGLSAACGVAPEDDDGNAAAAASPGRKILPAPILPATGAWDSLSLDTKTQMTDIVDGVRAEFASKGPLAAAKLWKEETAGLDADATVAGWSKLPSQERSAMKKLASQLEAA